MCLHYVFFSPEAVLSMICGTQIHHLESVLECGALVARLVALHISCIEALSSLQRLRGFGSDLQPFAVCHPSALSSSLMSSLVCPVKTKATKGQTNTNSTGNYSNYSDYIIKKIHGIS